MQVPKWTWNCFLAATFVLNLVGSWQYFWSPRCSNTPSACIIWNEVSWVLQLCGKTKFSNSRASMPCLLATKVSTCFDQYSHVCGQVVRALMYTIHWWPYTWPSIAQNWVPSIASSLRFLGVPRKDGWAVYLAAFVAVHGVFNLTTFGGSKFEIQASTDFAYCIYSHSSHFWIISGYLNFNPWPFFFSITWRCESTSRHWPGVPSNSLSKDGRWGSTAFQAILQLVLKLVVSNLWWLVINVESVNLMAW